MIGFLDCYSGLSGDMLLGAIVDAGLPIQRLEAVIDALRLGGDVRIWAETVDRSGLRATSVHVEARGDQPHRTLASLTRLVEASSLPEQIRASSLAVLTRIAEVEGRIHGRPTDEVELHELGALDSVIDVVGAVAGLAALDIDTLYASALPVSPGDIVGGHDPHLPGPAPATLALLAAARAPVRPFGEGRELITPTGAALVTTLARFEQPAMRLERVGYGAGSSEMPWPNVLRLWVGTPLADQTSIIGGHVVLKTSLDDMSPQLLAPATEALFAAGALDVAVSPLFMKKGRAGWLVTVIARASDESALADVLLRETTTLGVRVHGVRRYEAQRRQVEVDTPYGRVAVKLKLLDGSVVGAAPEFESVRETAMAAHARLSAVHAAASAAASKLVLEPLG
jgi:uncharacterized protein (TIGR00299 family) protein